MRRAVVFLGLFDNFKPFSGRPYDPRMWCAMAGCYEALNKDDEAVKCYERAALHDDRYVCHVDTAIGTWFSGRVCAPGKESRH